jgi:hypothetical protein
MLRTSDAIIKEQKKQSTDRQGRDAECLRGERGGASAGVVEAGWG